MISKSLTLRGVPSSKVRVSVVARDVHGTAVATYLDLLAPNASGPVNVQSTGGDHLRIDITPNGSHQDGMRLEVMVVTDISVPGELKIGMRAPVRMAFRPGNAYLLATLVTTRTGDGTWELGARALNITIAEAVATVRAPAPSSHGRTVQPAPPATSPVQVAPADGSPHPAQVASHPSSASPTGIATPPTREDMESADLVTRALAHYREFVGDRGVEDLSAIPAPERAPVQLRLGRRHVPVPPSWSGRRELKPFWEPVCYELGTMRTWTVTDSGSKGRADLAVALVQRLVSMNPRGEIAVSVIDAGGSASLAPLEQFARRASGFYLDSVCVRANEVTALLDRWVAHAAEVARRSLGGHATLEAAEVGTVPRTPRRILLILDLPRGVPDEAMQLLCRLCETGGRAGVHVVFGVDHPETALGLVWPQIDALATTIVAISATDADVRFQGNPSVRLRLDNAPSAVEWEHVIARWNEPAALSTLDQLVRAIRAGDGFDREAIDRLVLPLGTDDAGAPVAMRLGDHTTHHAIFLGRIGSGKTTLLQAVIAGGVSLYGGANVEWWLVDCKGTGFHPFARHESEGVRYVGLSADIPFGAAVLERAAQEMEARHAIFADAGTQDYTTYRRRTGARLPRIVLVIDEFQVLIGDRSRGHQIQATLESLVRRGRSAAIHLVLCSQSLRGEGSLDRATIGQIGARILLQHNASDVGDLLQNPAEGLGADRPRRGVYNHDAGERGCTTTFDAPLFHADSIAGLPRGLEPDRVFRGDIRPTRPDIDTLRDVFEGQQRVLLGETVGLDAWKPLSLRPSSGSNLLVVGRSEERRIAVLFAAVHCVRAWPESYTIMYPREFVPQAWRSRFEAVASGIDDMNEWVEEIGAQFRGDAALGMVLILPDLGVATGGLMEFVRGKLEVLMRDGPARGLHFMCGTPDGGGAQYEAASERRYLRAFMVRCVLDVPSTLLPDAISISRLGAHRALAFDMREATHDPLIVPYDRTTTEESP